jgi:hypothetical protein
VRIIHAGVIAILFTLLAVVPSRAEEGDGFVPMFNGKDLTGWVNVNCAPGTFFVKDGEIVTTGKPTGYLRTEKQYENFIAEFDWLHVNKTAPGNSGFFAWADPLPAVGTPYTRGIEVQVLVNLEKEGYYTSQGDLFSIHGATCKPDRPHPHGWLRCLPSDNRSKGGGEWNHYKVIGKDGVLKLHVNGKEVSGLSECRPRKGYLALESEGAECHFRNLKIKELPSSNPGPEETAEMARGFRNLLAGLELEGWRTSAGEKGHWQRNNWMLHSDGKGGALLTEKEFGDAEFRVDFRFARKGSEAAPCKVLVHSGKDQVVKLLVRPDGEVYIIAPGSEGKLGDKGLKPAGEWNRLRLVYKGDQLQVTINQTLYPPRTVTRTPARGAFGLQPEGEMDFGNVFVQELGK